VRALSYNINEIIEKNFKEQNKEWWLWRKRKTRRKK
jgi:hypothetical protein